MNLLFLDGDEARKSC